MRTASEVQTLGRQRGADCARRKRGPERAHSHSAETTHDNQFHDLIRISLLDGLLTEPVEQAAQR